MLEPLLMEKIDNYYHQQALLCSKLFKANDVDQMVDNLYVDIIATQKAYEELNEMKKINKFDIFDFTTFKNEDFYVAGNRLIITTSLDNLLSKYNKQSTIYQGRITVDVYKKMVHEYELKSIIDYFVSYNLYNVMQVAASQTYRKSYHKVGMC